MSLPPRFGKPAAPPTDEQRLAHTRGASRGTIADQIKRADNGRADRLLRRFD